MEILRRYANRLDLAHEVERLLRRGATGGGAAPGSPGPYEVGMAQRGRQRLVLATVREQDAQEIVARFAAGTPKHRLAAEYGMSLSSMKRLLRAERRRAVPRA